LPARPATGFIVLGVGLLCLALVPLLHWYVLPRVEVLPLDENATSVSTGKGTYFDQSSLRVTGPATLTVTTHVLGDVAAGEASGYAVWNISTVVDTPDTLPKQDPRLSLDWTLERWVGNRGTDQPVYCCGASAHFAGAYIKFPFDVAKQTYQFWNPKAKKAFPVHYAGTMDVQGLTLYRFQGIVPPTKIGSTQVPGTLVGLPTTAMTTVDMYYQDKGTEVDVDPVSGIPVVTVQHVVSTFRLPGSDTDRLTLLAVTFTTNQATRDTLVSLVKDTDNKLGLVQRTLPTVLLVAGAVLVVLGAGFVVLALRRSRRNSA
jgi:hypothetical protein